MEEEIKSEYKQMQITLIEGSGGVFEVMLDGKILFSKKELIGTSIKRFPNPGEIIELIERS